MVTITPVAEQKIQELMKEEKDIVGLRIYVRGGGCHGYQYGMAFESKMAEDDTVIEKGDVKVIMDSRARRCSRGRKSTMSTASRGPGSRSRTRRPRRRAAAAVPSAHKERGSCRQARVNDDRSQGCPVGDPGFSVSSLPPRPVNRTPQGGLEDGSWHRSR